MQKQLSPIWAHDPFLQRSQPSDQSTSSRAHAKQAAELSNHADPEEKEDRRLQLIVSVIGKTVSYPSVRIIYSHPESISKKEASAWWVFPDRACCIFKIKKRQTTDSSSLQQ